LRIGESRQRKKCTRFSKRCRALFACSVKIHVNENSTC
jgi:hypothetical protein